MRSRRVGHLISASLWLAVFIFFNLTTGDALAVPQTGNLRDTFYLPRSFECVYNLSDNAGSVSFFVGLSTSIILPMLIVIVTTIWLIVYLRTLREPAQRQTVITLVAVSVVYLVSYVLSVVLCFKLMFELSAEVVGSPSEGYLRFWAYFNRVAVFLQYLNFLANPFIYYVTVRSFKVFVKGVLRRMGRRGGYVGLHMQPLSGST